MLAVQVRRASNDTRPPRYLLTIRFVPAGAMQGQAFCTARPAMRAPTDFPRWRRVAAPGRVVRIDDGLICEIYEMECDGIGEVTRVLVFNHPAWVRRLRRYPSHWSTLPAVELRRLCEGDRAHEQSGSARHQVFGTRERGGSAADR